MSVRHGTICKNEPHSLINTTDNSAKILAHPGTYSKQSECMLGWWWGGGRDKKRCVRGHWRERKCNECHRKGAFRVLIRDARHDGLNSIVYIRGSKTPPGLTIKPHPQREKEEVRENWNEMGEKKKKVVLSLKKNNNKIKGFGIRRHGFPVWLPSLLGIGSTIKYVVFVWLVWGGGCFFWGGLVCCFCFFVGFFFFFWC